MLSDAIPLWPALAGESRGREVQPGALAGIHCPTLTPFEPEPARRNGAAVVVCPGGGYEFVSWEQEGAAAARWLRSLGLSAFVLAYRLPAAAGGAYRHPVPLSDLQQALRLVRSMAAERGVDAESVGVLGFSAGGHLAATAMTLSDRPVHRNPVSCRPDFGLLVYPVVSFVQPCAHAGSRRHLAGPDAGDDLLRLLSPEANVTSATPPAFIAHARNDNCVPYLNSVLLHEAFRSAGVPAELHLFRRGCHGFGLGEPHQDASQWPARAASWLRSVGIRPALHSH